jgi:hypothetical protein
LSRTAHRSRATLLPCALLFVGLFLAAAGAGFAADLLVPRERLAGLQDALDRDCPGCRDQGLSPCGTADVQVGKRFARTLFQGRPKRGYLLTFVMADGAFFAALVTPDRAAFLAAMRERFATMRLIAVEDGFRELRVLPPAREVRVHYPPGQHRCFGIEQRGASCCLGDGGSDRTCLPKADSPRVFLTFDDTLADEVLAVVYAPIAGFSQLRRSGGGRETLYYCLTSDAGVLKAR